MKSPQVILYTVRKLQNGWFLGNTAKEGVPIHRIPATLESVQIPRPALVPLLVLSLAALSPTRVQAAKMHFVTLGAVRKVPYTPPDATPDNKSEEATTLRIRPLIVDDKPREWTVGELHEITDRTFVIRRAVHINDSLPGEAPRWTWQPGPWLQVDRNSGHIAPLHLPEFDPQVSEVVWYRDYAAYCGLVPTLKGGVVAVVAELGTHKPVAQRVLANWPLDKPVHPVCSPAHWGRLPMRATLCLTGGEPVTFDVAGTSSLVEEGESEED